MGFPDTFVVDLAFGLSGGRPAKIHKSSSDGTDNCFPDANRFFVQVGNAVCPPIVAAIAAQLLKHCRSVQQMELVEVSSCPKLPPAGSYAAVLGTHIDSAVWSLLAAAGHDGWFASHELGANDGSCAPRPDFGLKSEHSPDGEHS